MLTVPPCSSLEFYWSTSCRQDVIKDTANHAQLGIMLLRSGEVVVLALKLIKHFMGLVPDHVDKSFQTHRV